MVDSYLGGDCRGKTERGSKNKVAFAEDAQLSEEGHQQVVRPDPVRGFTKEGLGHLATRYLGQSPRVVSDELNSFPGVEQARAAHMQEVIGAGRRSTDIP